MIDLEKGSSWLDKFDGFLTKLKTLLKKHWGILILVGIGVLIYWMFTLPPVEEQQEEYYSEPYEYYDDQQYEEIYQEYPAGKVKGKGQHQEEFLEEGYYVVKEEYIIDNYGYREGDTVYIDYYNDGYVEMYYSSDGEAYEEDI